MCWVAIDRGLRLADKNSLPLSAKQRATWLTSRDEIYGASSLGLHSSFSCVLTSICDFCRGGHGEGMEVRLPSTSLSEGCPRLTRSHRCSSTARRRDFSRRATRARTSPTLRFSSCPSCVLPLINVNKGAARLMYQLSFYVRQCFFISAADPRFRKTLDRILSPPFVFNFPFSPSSRHY